MEKEKRKKRNNNNWRPVCFAAHTFMHALVHKNSRYVLHTELTIYGNSRILAIQPPKLYMHTQFHIKYSRFDIYYISTWIGLAFWQFHKIHFAFFLSFFLQNKIFTFSLFLEEIWRRKRSFFMECKVWAIRPQYPSLSLSCPHTFTQINKIIKYEFV